MAARLELWRRAIVELKLLGIDAKVEIVAAGIRLRTSDGAKVIEQTVSTRRAEGGPGDLVFESLMDAVDVIMNGPMLTLIDGGKEKRG